MRRRYFGEEFLFEFIWQHCDNEGIWTGDAASLGEEFTVSEDEAYSTLSELCDRNLIEKVGKETYIITRWREWDETDEQ